MSNVQGIDIIQLRKNIDEYFNLAELRILCFELNIDFEKFTGFGNEVITLELVNYCKRHGRLLDLFAYCREARPKIEWGQDITPEQASYETIEARKEDRKHTYSRSRNIQMVHTIRPAAYKTDWWEILIYLTRHKSDDLSLIDYAEFFMGKSWKYKIFRVANQDDFIGIKTLAFGSFLCTCRVVFTDGEETMLSRYIDLEMAELFAQSIIIDTERSAPPPERLNNLLQKMDQSFSQSEIYDLCLAMSFDFEQIQVTESKRGQLRELIQYFSQDPILFKKLLQICTEKRPRMDWLAFLPDDTGPALSEEESP